MVTGVIQALTSNLVALPLSTCRFYRVPYKSDNWTQKETEMEKYTREWLRRHLRAV